MTTTASSTRNYALDPAHSGVHFSVRHMMIAKVRGAFERLSGTIALPAEGAIPTAVDVTVDASSIDTREPQRDAHLTSPDFLDVQRFPQLTFVSTAIRPIDDETFELRGDLTIHGITRSITAKATVEGQGTDPWGNARIAYETQFKISRKDFGLAWNQTLETGGVLVGDEIEITLDIEAIPAQ